MVKRQAIRGTKDVGGQLAGDKLRGQMSLIHTEQGTSFYKNKKIG